MYDKDKKKVICTFLQKASFFYNKCLLLNCQIKSELINLNHVGIFIC
jgi:hypothetical protein